MKALRFALVLGAMLFAAACLPVTSKTPIGTSAGPGTDPALIGTWLLRPEKGTLGAEEDVPGYFHFLADKDGTMHVLAIATGKDAKTPGEWSVFAASAVHLGGHDYLNARALLDNGKPATGNDAENTIPLLYRFKEDGSLVIALLDEDKTKAAIEAGKIEGTVEDGPFGDVTLTASPEKLDAFFATDEGAALFTENLLVLKPVK